MASSSSQGLIWLKYIADAQSFSGGLRLLNGWWEAINESQKWQEDAFYALCAAYAFVCLIALVLDMILLDLPGLLFFSTYTLLVLFWAEIYHQARSLPTDKLRPTYFIINGIVYFIQICIWMYMKFSKSDAAVEIAELFFSVISLGAAVGFVLYGGRLFVMLRRFPIESRGRQKKMHEVAVAAFDKNADIHVLNHPILDFVYYMIVEILPSALVLFILRKLPPRRASDQYHPIK
ncbi:hypothetical protein OSB04_030817 [Centaurea solstitialis]|uniref:THH1/TOM1/TOM3 domain-containing protein n=1 Tax=Centaurea solstitialis TaxID=347529 RepID=A0AA38W5D3_9ASTR|nr:hypothetical protein OSB04_030817 [Centaurea solstitialis]